MLAGIERIILDFVEAYGYPAIALLTLLETLFPPIPSEAFLPLAGFLSSRGHLTLAGAITAASIGSVGGAVALYGAGRWYGDERLRGAVRRWGRWVLLKEDDLDHAHEWFERHGRKAVLVGRLMPGVRSLISLPAGVTHMPLLVFVLYTAVGSVAWNALLIGLGWWLGHRWHLVEQYASYMQYAAIVAVVIAVGWAVWRRRGLWVGSERT